MDSALLGAGNVGGTLGARWALLGHRVVYGVRHPDGERTRAVLAASGPPARMADPGSGAEQPDDYICGDDAGAREVVAALSRELGFSVIDVGPLANARLLEGLALLWIDIAVRRGFGRDIASGLLRRGSAHRDS